MLKFGTPTIALSLAIKKMYCSDWMHCTHREKISQLLSYYRFCDMFKQKTKKKHE